MALGSKSRLVERVCVSDELYAWAGNEDEFHCTWRVVFGENFSLGHIAGSFAIVSCWFWGGKGRET